MKILIAEDERDTARLLEHILKKNGYQVIVKEDGEQAWETLQQEKSPRIVLLDWMMPKMTGLEVCQKIRESKNGIHSYIIIITAKHTKQDIIAALDAGADDYVVKPFDRDELLARLRVAERMVALNTELCQKIDELELLVRRHNLLTEVVLNRGKAPEGAGSIEKNTDTPIHPTNKFFEEVCKLQPIAETNHIVEGTFVDLGINSMTVIDEKDMPSNENTDFIAWSAMAIKSKGVWLDIKLGLNRDSIAGLYQQITGDTHSSNDDLSDILGEILNMIQGRFKMAFHKHGIGILTPVIPKSGLSEKFPRLSPEEPTYKEYFFSSGNNRLKMTVIAHSAAITEKTANQINVLDVLAEPVYTPKQKDVILFKTGTVLSNNYVARLKDLFHTGQDDIVTSIIEPSSLAKVIWST